MDLTGSRQGMGSCLSRAEPSASCSRAVVRAPHDICGHAWGVEVDGVPAHQQLEQARLLRVGRALHVDADLPWVAGIPRAVVDLAVIEA